MVHVYTVILVGSAGCGKSTLLKRHTSGEFSPKYLVSGGVEIVDLSFHTTDGLITLRIRDCPGNEKFRGLDSQNYQDAHAAIVMFDVTNKHSYSSVGDWIQSVKSVCPAIPIVLCGNKVDMPNRAIAAKNITWKQRADKYYDISALSNHNFEKPFLAIMKILTKREDLEFIAAQQA